MCKVHFYIEQSEVPKKNKTNKKNPDNNMSGFSGKREVKFWLVMWRVCGRIECCRGDWSTLVFLQSKVEQRFDHRFTPCTVYCFIKFFILTGVAVTTLSQFLHCIHWHGTDIIVILQQPLYTEIWWAPH